MQVMLLAKKKGKYYMPDPLNELYHGTQNKGMHHLMPPENQGLLALSAILSQGRQCETHYIGRPKHKEQLSY